MTSISVADVVVTRVGSLMWLTSWLAVKKLLISVLLSSSRFMLRSPMMKSGLDGSRR